MSEGSVRKEKGAVVDGFVERRRVVRRPSSGLGSMLVDEGLITKEQLAESLEASGEKFLGQVLDELGYLTADALTSFLVRRCKIPHLNLIEYDIEDDVLELLPKEVCRKHRLVPIDLMGSNITLAMVNPVDVQALAEVSAALAKFKIKRILCSNSDFEAVADRFLVEGKSEENKGMDNTFGLGPMPVVPKKKVAAASAPTSPSGGGAPLDSGMATMKVEHPSVDASAGCKPKHISLVCLDGWEIGREVVLGNCAEHILGRSRGANTCLDSQLVSREHAKIVCNREYGDEHFVLTDMGSSNGTYVNNVPVTSTSLHDGDKILIGDILFKFLIQDEVEARFHQEVHRLIHFHKQTGLLTIDAFRRQLEREMKRKGEGGCMTLAMTDLDGLKHVNDTYGHIAGSGVLSDMGDIMRKSLRDQDIPGQYGGDEAIILFTDMALDGAYALAEDLRRSFEAHTFKYKEESFSVTMSLGLAEWPRQAKTTDDLIAAADKALYVAKEGGRNRVCMAQYGD